MTTVPEFRMMDDDPMVIQKTLNQWAHQYHLKLHNPRYLVQQELPNTRMVVMVERTKR